MDNLGNCLIYTGPFSTGKTSNLNVLEKVLRESYSYLDLQRMADGPILVNLIREQAHGLNGHQVASNHRHSWMRQENSNHHLHQNNDHHFPFIVTDPEVGTQMFLNFTRELLTQSAQHDFVIAELGLGVGSALDWSTTRFIKTLKDNQLWEDFRKKIGGLVGVLTDWPRRLERNPNRPPETDGVGQSWLTVLDVLKFTEHSDYDQFAKEGIPLTVFNNNPPLDEKRIRDFFEREEIISRFHLERFFLGNKERRG